MKTTNATPTLLDALGDLDKRLSKEREEIRVKTSEFRKMHVSEYRYQDWACLWERAREIEEERAKISRVFDLTRSGLLFCLVLVALAGCGGDPLPERPVFTYTGQYRWDVNFPARPEGWQRPSFDHERYDGTERPVEWSVVWQPRLDSKGMEIIPFGWNVADEKSPLVSHVSTSVHVHGRGLLNSSWGESGWFAGGVFDGVPVLMTLDPSPYGFPRYVVFVPDWY